MVKCLKKVRHYPGDSKVTQITETCWCLAYAYWAAINATTTPATDPEATPIPEM